MLFDSSVNTENKESRIIIKSGLFFKDLNLDAHVKSPFYMDLGIKGFRNCKLFKGVTIISILKSGQITTF